MTCTAFYITTTKRLWLGVWLVVAVISSKGMAAQTPAAQPQRTVATGTPEERLRGAMQIASLDAVTSRPWHLNLAVTAFDEAGKDPQDGTVEVWHSGEDSRTVYTFGNSIETELHAGGKHYVSPGASIPEESRSLLAEILHPGPEVSEYKGAEAELQHQNFGKQSFDCIMLTVPLRKFGQVPLGLFPTYCMVHDTDELRISYNFGTEVTVRNAVGVFLGHKVATALSLATGTVTIARAKVTTLASFTPSDTEFTPTAGMKEVNTRAALISGGVMAGAILTKVPPVYPESARMQHVSGTVVLRAVIGRDGHIRSLRVMSTGDVALAISALAAVRQWRYKPYLLNGEPTQVDTTITVNFNLNPL